MTAPPDTSVQKHVWIIYALFVAATMASFAYCLAVGQFNGDFFPQPVFLPLYSLLAILVACLIPYAVTWKLAGAFDRVPPHQLFEPSPGALLLFLLIGFTLHIVATLIFGVGLADSEVYTAPTVLLPFIQVLNRLDPFYLGAFFILATPKRRSTDLLAVLLMLTTGFLRAGIGALAYIVIALCIKYRVELVRLFWRKPWLFVPGALALPTIISILYDIRGTLRGDMQYDYSTSEMLLGRFVGRLSSFSNVAFIEQNSQSFEWSSKMLEPLFYIKQGAVSLFGSGFAPAITPERLLISGTRAYDGYSTFMTGVPGNLIIAWHVSPEVAVLNLVVILASVAAILWISRYLGGGLARTFGLAMLIYPLTSGVANEFASLLLNTMIFFAFALLFSRRSRSEAGAHGG